MRNAQYIVYYIYKIIMKLKTFCLLIALILILGLLYLIYEKTEYFHPDFSFRQRRGTNKIWEDAKVVMIQNIMTNSCITYIPDTGIIRLEPMNQNNPYQYWIYSKDGYIMQPHTEFCISYPTTTGTGNDGSYVNPIINICSEYAGQVFIYDKPTKKLINRTQMPYYTMDRKQLLDQQQMRCLTWYPTIGGRGPRRLGVDRIAIVPCVKDDPKQQWNIIEMSIMAFENAKTKDYVGYTKITGYNNPRYSFYDGNLDIPFNSELAYDSARPRPYFNPQKEKYWVH